MLKCHMPVSQCGLQTARVGCREIAGFFQGQHSLPRLAAEATRIQIWLLVLAGNSVWIK